MQLSTLFRLSHWPLRVKLVVFLVLAAMVPLTIVSWIDIRNARAQLRTGSAAELAARGDQLAHSLDIFNDAYLQSTKRLAGLQAVVESCQERADSVEPHRRRALADLDAWPAGDANTYSVGILDVSGKVRDATQPALIGMDLSSYRAVGEALRGHAAVSSLRVTPRAAGGTAVVAYFAPVRDAAGKAVCLTAIWVRASTLWRMMKSSNGLAGPGSFAVLFDPYGIRMAHTYRDDIIFRPAGVLPPALRDQFVAEQRFGEATGRLLDDVRPFPEQFERATAAVPDAMVFKGVAPVNQLWNYGVARRLKTVAWTVFYMLPEESLVAQIASATRQRAALATVFLLLAALMGLLFGTTIVHSVRGLSAAARRFADGDLGARVAQVGPDELGQLGATFNAMASRIQAQTAALHSAQDDLERRVQERTAELEEVTKDLRAEVIERRRIEKMSHGQQQLLQAVIDNSVAVIYVKDMQGRYLLVNRHFCAIFEQDGADAVVGKTDHELFPAAAADVFRAMDLRAAVAQSPLVEEEDAPHHDGVHTYVSVKSRLLDDRGQVYGVFGISTDITERKVAENGLRAQVERLGLLDQITRSIGERQDPRSIYQVVVASLEDQLPVDFAGICSYDALASTLAVVAMGARSHALAQDLSLAERTRIDIDENGLAQGVRGQLVYEPDLQALAFAFPQRLVRGGLHAMVIAPLQAENKVFGVLVAARRDKQSFSSGECEFLRQLSEHVALAAQQARLYGALQQAYEDLKQTQDAVQQQERLRTLGQMASGVAHDINNAISPVALYTESLLEREPNLSPRTRDYLEQIRRAISDVAATVSRMREFYRQRESQAELAPVQLNVLAQQVMDLTRARWSDMEQGRGVMIEPLTELQADLPVIMGVESELREALTNLIFNAVDAMPGGGRLTLRTRVQPAPALHGACLQQVCIDVEDSGMGMSEETRSRCVEPFYTTKGERGTGLGLAMVYGTVQRHGADLDIRSAPGHGTTVTLRFATTASVAAVPTIEDPGAKAAQRCLRILVVDDDPFLLRAVTVALRSEGHVVVPANGGQEGIDAFVATQGGEGTFDVVITDLGMPYVDGRKVAAAIKGMDPAMPVVMLTGWGQRLVTEGDIPEHVDQLLAKPPKLMDLRATLAQLCAGPAP